MTQVRTDERRVLPDSTTTLSQSGWLSPIGAESAGESVVVSHLRGVIEPMTSPVLPHPDPDQSAALSDPHGTVLVMGGPGTGRTTVCVERAARYLSEGGRLGRVLMVGHSRGAAQDLRNDLLVRVGGAHLAPRVTTVHALAADIVSQHSAQPARLLTAPEQEFRIRELLAGSDLSSWPEYLRAGSSTARFASDLRVLAAALRQEGRDPSDLADAGRLFGVDAWMVLGPFLSTYLDVLDLEQTMDYAEAVHRARILLTDPGVLAAVTDGIDLLVVDEFGETDPSQAALLAAIAGAGTPTLLAVDPDQTAFEFRGAVPGRLAELVGLFPDVAVHHLRVDHRCAERVHAATEQIRGAMALVPAAAQLRRSVDTADRPGGRVEFLVSASAARGARAVAEQLRRAHLRDGVAWDEMAVVTRHGSDIAALSAVLSTEGVPVHRSRDESALSGVHAVQVMLGALEAAAALADGGTPGPAATAALLAGPLSGLDQAACDRVEEWARRSGTGPVDWGVLTAVLGEGADADHRPGAITPGLARAVAPARDMLRRIGRAGRELVGGAEVHGALWTIWGRCAWASRLQERALSGDATADRELDGLCSLFDLAERSSTLRGQIGATRFVGTVRQEEIPADRSRESDRDRIGVSLMTAHRAKGRQFAVVAVTGLQEGSWPAPNHTGSLVGADRWSPDGPVSPPGWVETVRAERRLLLLACSRARDTLVLSAVDDQNAGLVPSAFFTELASDATTGDAGTGEAGSTRMPDLVGRLRRAALDPDSSPQLRDRAAGILTRLAAEGVRQADPRRWWLPGADPRPAVDAPAASADERSTVNLSASHVGELLTCPRQWFLTRRAGASGVRGPRASVGTLVHKVASETMADGWSLEEALRSLDEGWEQIDFEIGWQSRTELEGARQALTRLDRWLDGRPGRLVGTEVAFDHTFDLPSARVRFRGSIDRLERDETGRLLVVDLKAGTSTSPQVARAHQLQVGVYQAVVAAGGVDSVAAVGPVAVGGAELVHLRRGAGRGGADPKVVRQPSLVDVAWPDGEEPPAHPDPRVSDWILARIDEAAAIATGGDLRAVPNPGCGFCPVRSGCPALVPPQDPVDDERGVAAR